MNHYRRSIWENNDISAEDLIFTKPSKYASLFEEEDQVNEPNYLRNPIHTFCFPLTAIDSNDYTSSGTTLADTCTFYIGRATMPVTIESATEYHVLPGQADGNDYSHEESIRLAVEFEEDTNEDSYLIQEIQGLYREYSENNWDGYGADRISPGAYLEAKKVAGLLPPDLPVPDVMPEPNGNIAFEWYRSKRYIFVLSVEGSSVINYAGLSGRVSKVHGSEHFTDEIPASILERIHNLFR